MTRRAFTLVEILVVFGVFIVISAIVLISIVGLFRNWQQGQTILAREQRQRLCMLRLSREVGSLTKISYPDTRFSGAAGDFFFIFAREDKLVESRYKYNSESGILEHYFQSPTDYIDTTYQEMDPCISGLGECKFSYSNGTSWSTYWDQGMGQLPRMIKINFKFSGDTKERELIVNIPVSQ